MEVTTTHNVRILVVHMEISPCYVTTRPVMRGTLKLFVWVVTWYLTI